ncbi:MAG: enoyl-CoA hydratase/isomerase family protein [Caulobacterales bacterium]|nr:enoyl-CoA hydratase/isomerase family protein [Caulobacterales bacterium]
MENEVLFEIKNNLGIIVLNRPFALNALNTNMCNLITTKLLEFEQNEKIGAVLIMGAGEKAFCAGGDIIMISESGKAKDNRAEAFWRAEYALNEFIKTYSKPYIALIDGIVMGGGVGLSLHGKYRIAGESTLFAMPETGIGYFPDVGGTYFLPRLSRAIGNWLGLTGARLNGVMCYNLGLANYYVTPNNRQNLINALIENELDGGFAIIEEILNQYSSEPPKFENLPNEISVFDNDSLDEIFTNIFTSDNDWQKAQAKILKTKSPFAMAVTFEALKKGMSLNFRAAMSQELVLSLNFLTTPDIYEGIRAQLIDKDKAPKWQNTDILQIEKANIDKMFIGEFAPLEFIKRN